MISTGRDDASYADTAYAMPLPPRTRNGSARARAQAAQRTTAHAYAYTRADTQPVQDYTAPTPGGRDELLAHTVPTFINVKQACEARGTSLIVSNMTRLNTTARGLFWIGAQETVGERGAFEFLDGSPLSRDNPPCPTCPKWGAGEPNGDVSAALPALCVGYLRGFGLFDAPCDQDIGITLQMIQQNSIKAMKGKKSSQILTFYMPIYPHTSIPNCT